MSAYGPLLVATGRLNRALEFLERALEMDHLNDGKYAFLMEVHEQLGDREAADDVYRRSRTLFGAGGTGEGFRRWILLGRGDLAPILDDPERVGALFVPFAKEIRDPDRALELLHAAAADPDYAVPTVRANLAIWAAYFGDAPMALRLLEESVSASALLMHLAWLPVFDDVRRLPEFKELLIDIGLVDFWRDYGWPDVCGPTGDDDFACL